MGRAGEEAYLRGVSRLAHRARARISREDIAQAQPAVTEDLEERYALVCGT